jgi:protein disulfide-isomerase
MFAHMWHVFRNFISGHPWLAIGALIGFLLTGSVFGRSRMRRKAFVNTGAFFQLGEKETLLGGGPGGKKD